MWERTLYLNEKEGMEVKRDGPSLWVQEQGKAGVRIPIRLVGHVVIMGNVKMDSSSITLFTDHNIPVTFIDKKGHPIAMAIPYSPNLQIHYRDQKAMLAHEERIEMYKQWLISERRKVQLQVIKKLSKKTVAQIEIEGLREIDYFRIIKRYLPQEESRWKPVKSVIVGLINEMILKEIIAMELDPHIGIYNRRRNFGLLLDFLYALEPEADLQTAQFFDSNKAITYLTFTSTGITLNNDGIKNVVHRFENKKELTQRLIDNLLDSFFEFMRNVRFQPHRKIRVVRK